MDTIFALASARGRAGVAVIRISGSEAPAVTAQLAGIVPSPRRAALRDLTSVDGTVLDQALVLTFQEGASFTGEAVTEFHLHGSQAVVAAVLAELRRQPEVRPAEAGEFTRRALENDRLDLTQVEGLGALIEAETEAQRRQAMRTMSGALRTRVETWRESLIRAAALVEATIDFADEDVPVDVFPEVRTLLSGLCNEFDAEIRGARMAERLREGFEVAIVGPTNAGKSTLLNRLARREAAITSEIAGTTRDVIEVRMDLEGLPVTFLDTAGLRETEDAIERIGVARTRERASQADLRIFLSCGEDEVADLEADGDVRVAGKADLGGVTGLSVSGVTGEGTDELLARVVTELVTRMEWAATATHERHAAALRGARAYLSDALLLIEGQPEAPDLIAAEVRGALHSLDVLIGRVDVEMILGHIFESFCIGK